MTDTATTACPRCGALTPAANRFCGSCGASISQGISQPAVGTAIARADRLSDSGALELREMLMDATQGDFEILSELGRGGMAIVYRATDVHLARTVAVKVLPPDLTFAKGATERFQREAKTAAALDHPNIIPIYRISSTGRLFWYAMKYLEGRSLADIILEKGLLTVSETIAILDQVAVALDYAHQRNVVHRDVKPGNVMLDANGWVTVTDFGIAKELLSGALTGSGAILGTPYYMSPEQCRGGANITGAADQYSLAVMAYQMVSGQLPFEADSAIDVIHQHISESPPPLENLLPDLPRGVTYGITRAMSKKAEDRFPTVQSFVNALKGSPAEVTLVMERRPEPPKAPRRSGVENVATLKGSVQRVAAGLVLFGGLVTEVVWLTNKSHLYDAEPAPPAARAPRTVPHNEAPPGTAPRAAAPRTGTASAPPTRTRATRHATAPPPAAARTGPKGYLRIRVSNGYATINIAGKTIEDRPVWADSLPAGVYPVTFTREGRETLTTSVTVRSGQETPLTVTLRPKSTP
jgi:serine/threonine-protein kinase